MEVSGKQVADENGKTTLEPANSKLVLKELCLRIFLFLLSLTAVVVMVTSNQTKLVQTPYGPYPVSMTAKFSDFPAFIYFVVALSVSLSYSIITALATLWILKKGCSSKNLLKFYLVSIANDVVMVGVVAAATGAAGCVGYLGINGNSKVRWTKICNMYSKNCRQIGSSIIISLAACILLVMLVVLSAYSVHRLARKALN
ncbi:CASP-like protein 1 [Macadamia integrifolia]|uniref:CASP-like protein 1 n=1 Tax=Macadamia integrifolia TaxID=60698 RepID=UPI001C4E7B5C|nr:CASP-like protein 1 [Macadamia integrifolia]